jgi:Right handed beta helix region
MNAIRPFKAAATVAVTFRTLAAAAVIHVSPTGDDGGDGTTAKPLRTAEAALTRSRSQGEHTIEFADGIHRLGGPLRLGPSDSGLVLRAAHSGAAKLAGGREIHGWNRSKDNPQIWEASLPETASGSWKFHQLFVGGRRAQVARSPREGFHRFAARLGDGSPIEAQFAGEDIRPEWAGSPDARVIVLMKWTDLRVPILSVDAAKHTARFPGGPRAPWMDEPDARYWVENAPGTLGAPGEWQLDTKAGVLRYFGGRDFNPEKAVICAPVTEQLLLLEGDASGHAVENVRIEGLRFGETEAPTPDGGMISPQIAEPVHAALIGRHAVRVTITDCDFSDLGGYAVEAARGCQDWKIVGNRITDMGGGGVRIGEAGDRSPSDYDSCHSHRVEDNEIARLGRVFAPAGGVVIFQSGTNHVAHNHIHDLYYTGISVGWTWGYDASPCRANVIEYNVVEDIGQGRLSDMGGIYTLGPQPGTIIRGNIFRNVVSYDYGGWGFYTDEGSTGILVENNLSVGCKSAGFHQHYGRDNVIRWNVLVDNVEHQMMRTRNEDHRSFWFTNNVVMFHAGDLLGSDWNGGPKRFVTADNIYWNPAFGGDPGRYSMSGTPFPAWQAAGNDEGSRIVDPKFKDPARPELGFQADSPVWAAGFKWIDLTKSGVRPPGRRGAPDEAPRYSR